MPTNCLPSSSRFAYQNGRHFRLPLNPSTRNRLYSRPRKTLDPMGSRGIPHILQPGKIYFGILSIYSHDQVNLLFSL